MEDKDKMNMINFLLKSMWLNFSGEKEGGGYA